MGISWSRIFPPEPAFTEKDVPDLAGNQVFIVTGASSGLGKELAKILFSRNAKVYIAARSKEKAIAAIQFVESLYPESGGQLIFLYLDLSDLTGIKASVDEFLAKEDRLDVLWNNAGVMGPSQPSETQQGYDLHLGTNCLAPFLLTKLLLPLLIMTAHSSERGSVRVAWVSSLGAELLSPKGGVSMENPDYKQEKSAWMRYSITKAGNFLYAKEFAKRYENHGIISVSNQSLDPGNSKSEITRHRPWWEMMFIYPIFYPAMYGAYTELYAGLSPEVTLDMNGDWIIPWGRIAATRDDLRAACLSKEDGGTGNAAAVWEWSEDQIKPYI